jgi:erythromycin esterase
LGESAHGVREFYQLKHRLLEFLVESLSVTAVAVECSHAACQALNDFVVHRAGDLPGLLTA